MIGGKPANTIIMSAGILFAQIESQPPKLHDPIAFEAMIALVRATAIHHANTLRTEKQN
jgi:hypothetical protein